ncbi:hypothetical protein Tco_1480809, partial [Tanacetum coccineum]
VERNEKLLGHYLNAPEASIGIEHKLLELEFENEHHLVQLVDVGNLRPIISPSLTYKPN